MIADPNFNGIVFIDGELLLPSHSLVKTQSLSVKYTLGDFATPYFYALPTFYEHFAFLQLLKNYALVDKLLYYRNDKIIANVIGKLTEDRLDRNKILKNSQRIIKSVNDELDAIVFNFRSFFEKLNTVEMPVYFNGVYGVYQFSFVEDKEFFTLRRQAVTYLPETSWFSINTDITSPYFEVVQVIVEHSENIKDARVLFEKNGMFKKHFETDTLTIAALIDKVKEKTENKALNMFYNIVQNSLGVGK